jgi:DNA-binding LacI/PurR family transcriptional regulator
VREPVLIVPPKSPTREEEGRRAARRLVARPDGIDAVFAACDAMALGALEAFTAADLVVPRDMGVMGFDDLLAGRFSRPPLTSIGPDPAEAGVALVEAVLGGGAVDNRRRVPVALVARASTQRL